MRLRDLDAAFIGELSPDGKVHRVVDSLEKAQGVMFQCPKCATEAGGQVVEEDGERFVVGVHSIICWFNDRGVPSDLLPGPGRWNPQGTGLDDLTFIGPGLTSVWLKGEGCGWHGHVTAGEAN